MSTSVDQFISLLQSPLRLWLLFWKNLPIAAVLGVKVIVIDSSHCSTQLRYKWLTKNPFNSMYWGMLAIGAEISTGLLLLMHAYKKNPGVSIYIIGNTSKLMKRALGKTTFICKDGDLIKAKIDECIQRHSSATFTCTSYAFNESQELLAEFTYTWSIKAK